MNQTDFLTLADQGYPTSVIIVPADAGRILCKAAQDLQATMEKIIGIAPLMGADDGQPASPNTVSIHLGETRYVRALGVNSGSAGVEGYRIAASGSHILILGGSECGTSYGVYGLLEDHLNVRWFMPGELFEDIPIQTTLRIPPIDETVTPHFLHRVFSGIAGLEGSTWEIRNRSSVRRPALPYSGFHHALYSIFPVAVYGETHPEYYALIDGKRLVPENDTLSNVYFGQPCTSNPDVIEVTIEAARHYFDEHPEAHCFSLGMNDNRNFCQCENCLAQDIPDLTFRDHPVYSDRWYTFVNHVAKGLQESHPGKFVGCIAYMNVEEPPRHLDKLEPNVTIYVTQDSSQHMDPAYQHKDREFIRSWTEKCDHVCKYDYYALGWMLPRYFPGIIADDIEFQRQTGVKGFYAEAYPYWAGFGPHVWLAAKLWWNTDQDAAPLMDEFFDRLFRDASVHMRSFYDLMEEIWLRPRKGRWFQGLDGIHDQVTSYTMIDVDDLEAILERAYGSTQDPLVRLRIDYIRRWFPFPATLIKGWHKANEILSLPPGEETEILVAQLLKIKLRITEAYQSAILEDRLMFKTSYFNDGRYKSLILEPWIEKIDEAVAHAHG